MNYYIITGASRGLGQSLAYKLLAENNFLFCISRTVNDQLKKDAQLHNYGLEYIEYDLNDIDEIEDLVGTIFSKIKANVDSICLINNSGIVNPIKPLGKCESNDLIQNVNINLIAPMILTNEFIKHTEKFSCDKTIINISSGAGRKPYYGWGAYCSSKAGVDMLTKCVGVEQMNKEHKVKIISFAPGIIDTMMQNEIRNSNKEDFEQYDRFIKFKEEGHLSHPDVVAEKVIGLISNKDLVTGQIMDIKEL